MLCSVFNLDVAMLVYLTIDDRLGEARWMYDIIIIIEGTTITNQTKSSGFAHVHIYHKFMTRRNTPSGYYDA